MIKILQEHDSSSPRIKKETMFNNGETSNEKNLADAKQELKVRMHQFGLLKVDKATAEVKPVAITVFPRKYPRWAVEEAVSLAPIYNKLVHAVAMHDAFLINALTPAAELDEFTFKLLDLYKKYGGKRSVQPIKLGINRSDFFLADNEHKVKQIELNTISCGLLSLAPLTAKVHEENVVSLTPAFSSASASMFPQQPQQGGLVSPFIANPSLQNIASAIRDAHSLYVERHSSAKGGVVLFVVQPNEWNVFDQNHLSHELFEKHHIRTIRATLEEVSKQAALDAGGRLLFQGREISVVYFRSGYSPKDYTPVGAWEGRELIEKSFAIKAPCIAYQLVGSKKIQQLLSSADVLRSFHLSEDEIYKVMRATANQYEVSEANEAIVTSAYLNPSKFVLKPNREGGGNNLFDAEMQQALMSFSKQELRNNYVLMERLYPTPDKNTVFFINNEFTVADSISELGIFSVFLIDGQKQKLNCDAGYLLRTKFASSNEGGVSTGSGALDSLYLI